MENSILHFFYVKDFIFRNLSVKCISWQIFNKFIENQDLFRNKDNFSKKDGNKNLYFIKKRFNIL